MGQLDYAIIGNCQISALIDARGSYAWLCLPRFDSPAVFGSLLGGEAAGVWSCLPECPEFEARSRYLRNTNVLHTEYHLPGGDRYDAYDFAPRFALEDGYYHLPQVVRILRPVRGNPRLRPVLRPRFGYGRTTPRVNAAPGGLVYEGDAQTLYLDTDLSVSYLLEERPFELRETRYFVLSYGQPLAQGLKFACEQMLERTIRYWRTWVKHCNIPFEYQEEVIRSALALKLHIFEDTGAIIAATTTSIPESPYGNRTWDYRYCWLRDAYFVIHVLNQLGHFDEMEHFIEFLHNIASSPSDFALQPVYGISGERILTEVELPWLPGFGGIGPVRVGNAAYAHAQYDVYGEMVLAVTPLFFDRRLSRTDLQRAFDNVVQLVDKAIAVFDEPDSGIWEFRSERRHYTFSKLMCWVAVDRGVQIARRMDKPDWVERWARCLGPMRDRIERLAWSEQHGLYGQSYGSPIPDASNLLLPVVGFHAPGDPRLIRMIEEYRRALLSDGYVFRYRNADDFGVPCHAFTICTFWMVDALAAAGRKPEARALFERVLSSANHVGLLSEDVDPVSGELWGNFPQTYSHVGVINSAFRLSKSWQEAF
jgi:GH15 family glucan-1,4-alpha-glucosidase